MTQQGMPGAGPTNQQNQGRDILQTPNVQGETSHTAVAPAEPNLNALASQHIATTLATPLQPARSSLLGSLYGHRWLSGSDAVGF
ncbi:hypothetical protein RSAG8_05228, partial [Rhizoctonia solani AG-8 WAC10335]